MSPFAVTEPPFTWTLTFWVSLLPEPTEADAVLLSVDTSPTPPPVLAVALEAVLPMASTTTSPSDSRATFSSQAATVSPVLLVDSKTPTVATTPTSTPLAVLASAWVKDLAVSSRAAALMADSAPRPLM